VSPKTYLLDTSALLAFIEDEAGAERVEGVLKKGEVWLPWVALHEAYYITFRDQGQGAADTRYALIKQLPARLIWELDEPTLLTAARLKAMHRLSFADSIVAALAIQKNAILLHKDPEFDSLAEMVPLEALPYTEKTGKLS
jgi:predicted nucleic acid-binding protein